jgi:hypothetical protein
MRGSAASCSLGTWRNSSRRGRRRCARVSGIARPRTHAINVRVETAPQIVEKAQIVVVRRVGLRIVHSGRSLYTPYPAKPAVTCSHR